MSLDTRDSEAINLYTSVSAIMAYRLDDVADLSL